jgi:hypothetical protein
MCAVIRPMYFSLSAIRFEQFGPELTAEGLSALFMGV